MSDAQDLPSWLQARPNIALTTTQLILPVVARSGLSFCGTLLEEDNAV